MNIPSFRRLLLALAMALALTPASVLADWTTYHLDQSRTGNDTTEPAATNVSSAWNANVSGQIYAEPLIVGNTVLVATEQNNVYGLDAATGAVLWSNTSLGTPVTQSTLPCGNINPVVGITGTPVVDTATSLMYVVATLAQPNVHYELYAININNGATAWHETVSPSGNPIYQGQRSALALANGRVYIPFGGRSGDCGTYSGTVVGALASGPGSLVSYALPAGHEGGIWAPSGSAVDGSGNVYVTTGNTTCGSTCNPFDFGETVLKLSPTLGLVDWWAPTNWPSLNAGDTDQQSHLPGWQGRHRLHPQHHRHGSHQQRAVLGLGLSRNDR